MIISLSLISCDILNGDVFWKKVQCMLFTSFLFQKTKSLLPESICNKKKKNRQKEIKQLKKTICLKLLHFHQYLTLINKQHVQMVSLMAHQLQLCWEISQKLQYKQIVIFIIQEVTCFRKKRK